jgi:hypothetical protein
MPEPVIIDDGGSTRIKQVKQNAMGVMDSLLDVNSMPGTNRMKSEHTLTGEVFSRILIVYQDGEGNPKSFLINAFDTILISSQFGQNVQVTKNNNGEITVTVFSDVIEPMMEARQHKNRRRYLVSNSGPIETVRIDGSVVYDTAANGGQTTPHGIAKPIIYTSIVIT